MNHTKKIFKVPQHGSPGSPRDYENEMNLTKYLKLFMHNPWWIKFIFEILKSNSFLSE